MEVREKFLKILNETGKQTVTRKDIDAICVKHKLKFPQWFTKDEKNRAGRGLYSVISNQQNENKDIVNMSAQVVQIKKTNKISSVITDIEVENLIPKQYENYVAFGNFSDVYNIIKSNQFFPVLITGHSGNGKTMSVEQACAKAKRKFICVSMTPESDESDLLGNFVLINGEMEWRDGPVTVAARQGAVLCIDEIDYGGQNLSCLQRVLEGKPFLLKKKNEIVNPAPGFTIVATANTKGKGSEDGRYMFTNVLNEAFLERFLNTMEQDWPSVATERKIIDKEMASLNCQDSEFSEKLVMWADVIRKTFKEGGIDEVISTRRLVHIVKTFSIFGDREKAVNLCLNRFDDDTKKSFLDLYSKLWEDKPADNPAEAPNDPYSDDIPS